MVIAMPSAPARRIGEVVSLLQQSKLKDVTVPSIGQLTSGTVQISQLRPVNIEDLLGREPIDLHLNEIAGILENRTILVTGAGGSIGSELCRQIAAFQPRCLLLLEQSEVQLFQIEQQLIKLGYGAIIVPIIADILDRPRMNDILRRYHPAVIFHAAAHKHVTMMEIQPGEAIKNNSLGTAGLAALAFAHGVERFVMISTDKAVNPTSVMGASKRLAEVFLQAFAKEFPDRTKFAAVRFGNVLGSSGSVVPIFERQIAEGGPITVTHPEVVRFFMTIPEAVGLVLQDLHARGWRGNLRSGHGQTGEDCRTGPADDPAVRAGTGSRHRDPIRRSAAGRKTL
ncbi:MAG: polysaccharide biosynthesis protein [Verrucomicrobiota bacterium]